MSVELIRRSLAAADPPPGLTQPVQALWWAAKGDWDRAHRIVQDDDGRDAAWVHAYLHRVEGDAGNAAYWYNRAAKPVCATSLDDEWTALVSALL